MNFKFSPLVFFIMIGQFVSAQCPSVDFILPSDICSNQPFNVSASYQNVTNFSWDFCDGSILNIPTELYSQSVPQSSSPFDLKIIQENGNYFAFAPNLGSGSITKISFGNSIENSPALDDLGNFGMITGALGIGFWLENGNNFAIVSTNPGDVFLLSFGNSVDNLPQVSKLTGISLPNHRNIKIIKDGGNILAFIAGGNTSYLSILNFGSTINNIPSLTQISVPNSNVLHGIDIFINCNLRYVVMSGYGSGIHILQFGSDFLSTPSSIINFGEPSPTGLSIVTNSSEFFLLVSSETEGIVRFDMGNSFLNTQPNKTILGFFATLNQAYGFQIVTMGSQYYGAALNFSNSLLTVIKFPKSCNILSSFENNNSPLVQYTSENTYTVTLSATGSNNEKVFVSKVMEISYAKNLTFSTVNDCAGHDIIFNPTNFPSDATLINWSFGDSNGSTQQSPTYQYTSAGNYNVTLSVSNSIGCSRIVTNSVSVFNPPQSSMLLPSANPICSNQNYLFTNTTTFDNGSNPTWQWNVNGINVATTRDLDYLIASTVPQSVTLTASIPGCSSQSIQTISIVQDGPLVNFTSPANGCINSIVTFTNASTGAISSYNWNFGDGNSSSQTDASNTYQATGVFTVTLTASNAAGCQNFLAKNFPVYSNPRPDFVIESPPFSCANYPAQFDNNTPPLSDSNIATWAWSFGDAANGTSNQKNPTYTYSTAASYNVTLQGTTNFGCSGTKQQNVVIYASPQAGFTNTPACVNENTQFNDASSGNITSYQWVIQSTILSAPSPPPYVFKSAGTFPVTLTTTSSNNCKNQVVKNITVPVPPVMDFIFQPTCTGKPITFQELNPGGPDPSVAWNWNFGSGSSTGSPVNYTFDAAGGYSVTLSATRSSGCVYSTSKNITIYDGPTASFIPSTQGGGAPLTVDFNNTSLADSYLWQFGDQSNSTSTEVSPVFTYSQLGQYKALLQASNVHGCVDTVSAEIYVVVPKVDLAMKDFSLLKDPASNSSNPVVRISNLGNIPISNPEVLIDLGGNAILKEKINATVLPGKSVQQTLSLEIVPQSLGYICAEVTPAGDVDMYNDRQCLSLTGSDTLYNPYPNPANNIINLDWISAENETVVVTIYKSTGQVTFQQNLPMTQSGINQFAIDISSLSSGLYLIEFFGTKVKKTYSVSVVK